MRKFAAFVGTVSVFLMVASTASAGVVQGFNVEVSPAKKSKSKKKQTDVSLRIRTATDTDDGTPPPVVKNVKIVFPKGWIFNSSTFPTCAPSSLEAQNEAACSKAKVGGGTAEVKAFSQSNPGIPPIVAQAQVTAYNATPSGGKPRIMLYATTTEPVSTHSIFTGTLAGRTLNLPIEIANPIPDSKIAITKFDVKVNKTKVKKKSYVAASPNCSGKWQFASTFQFADAEPKQVAAEVKCKKK